METWATFSIIDHRRPVYRQALAIFDKIVVPIPDAPMGNQTLAELQQLDRELDYLVANDAAVRYPWNSQLFQEWQQPFIAEAISGNFNRDPYYDTRLMLADQFETNDVETMPVYGDQVHHDRSRTELQRYGETLTVAITQRLPVPDHDTPLEDIIKLRNCNAAFQTALANMLEWKRHMTVEILAAPDRGPAIAAAMRDFDRLTKAYAEAMDAAGHHKTAIVASIFLSAATLDVSGLIKEGLVSFSELREPSWKSVSNMKCAAAGIVYHFQQALL